MGGGAQLLALCNRLTKPEASVKEMWLTYTKNDELHGEKNPDFIKGDVFNEHEGCRKLFAALTKNSSLTFLSMAKKGIRDEGCVYVADCLKKNKTLKSLDLKFNTIGDEGMVMIGNALKQNSTLTEIDLAFNNFKDEGCAALAEALEQPTCGLRKLGLHAISMCDDPHFARIARALEKNQSVTSIDLGWCTIGQESLAAFGDALLKNNTLTHLDIQYTDYKDADADKFLGYLLGERNRSLVDLRMDHIRSHKFKKLLSDFLEANRESKPHSAEGAPPSENPMLPPKEDSEQVDVSVYDFAPKKGVDDME